MYPVCPFTALLLLLLALLPAVLRCSHLYVARGVPGHRHSVRLKAPQCKHKAAHTRRCGSRAVVGHGRGKHRLKKRDAKQGLHGIAVDRR
jgi:hypothetical protein